MGLLECGPLSDEERVEIITDENSVATKRPGEDIPCLIEVDSKLNPRNHFNEQGVISSWEVEFTVGEISYNAFIRYRVGLVIENNISQVSEKSNGKQVTYEELGVEEDVNNLPRFNISLSETEKEIVISSDRGGRKVKISFENLYRESFNKIDSLQ